MLHGKCAIRFVCASNASRYFSDKMNDRERRLVRRRRIFHGGNFQNRAGRDVGPVHAQIEPPDQFGMRMAFFRDEFEFGFVIERRLLRFGEPGFAERLQPRKVVRRDRVSRQQRRVEHEPRPGVRVEQTGRGQVLEFLKNRNRRPRLRAERGVNRPGEIARRARAICASNTSRAGCGKPAGDSGATTNGRRRGATAFAGARTTLAGCSWRHPNHAATASTASASSQRHPPRFWRRGRDDEDLELRRTRRLSHRPDGDPRPKSARFQIQDRVANQFRGVIVADQAGIGQFVSDLGAVDMQGWW